MQIKSKNSSMDDLTFGDAFTLAISLAATAPNNDKAKECLQYAFDIASKLDPKEIGLCFMSAAVVTEMEPNQ